MIFWATLVLYEVVWFITVIGVGRGFVWPALLATGLFAVWRLTVTRSRAIDLRLVLIAFVLGLIFDGALVAAGVLTYAAAWPAQLAPAWMLALWIAFALTIVPLFGTLHARPWLAASVGAIGGPLSYLAAARGWHAVNFSAPLWHAVIAIAIGWGIALPLLTTLAHRWARIAPVANAFAERSAS